MESASHDDGSNAADAGPRRARIALGLVAVGMLPVGMLPVGVQAAAAPRSFYDDFPLGRSWIASEGGPYNEHLVRDVGGLFLALVIVTAWTIWRRGPTGAVAVAWLVQGLLHFAYHVAHLDHLETGDAIAQTATLASVPVLAASAIWFGFSSPSRRPPAIR